MHCEPDKAEAHIRHAWRLYEGEDFKFRLRQQELCVHKSFLDELLRYPMPKRMFPCYFKSYLVSLFLVRGWNFTCITIVPDTSTEPASKPSKKRRYKEIITEIDNSPKAVKKLMTLDTKAGSVAGNE